MSEIDQQFIEYVVKSLVGKPDAVKIERRIDEKGVLLELTVDPEDLGRVIGKRGATAQSLRTLLRALGTKNDARYNLKIIDNGDPAAHSQRTDNRANDDRPAKQSKDDQADQPAAADEPTEPLADEPAEAPSKPEPETPEPETKPADDDAGTSDRLAAAREELAELDDLDI